MWERDLERFRRSLIGHSDDYMRGVEAGLRAAYGQIKDGLPLDAGMDVHESVSGSYEALLRAFEEALR